MLKIRFIPRERNPVDFYLPQKLWGVQGRSLPAEHWIEVQRPQTELDIFIALHEQGHIFFGHSMAQEEYFAMLLEECVPSVFRKELEAWGFALACTKPCARLRMLLVAGWIVSTYFTRRCFIPAEHEWAWIYETLAIAENEARKALERSEQ